MKVRSVDSGVVVTPEIYTHAATPVQWCPKTRVPEYFSDASDQNYPKALCSFITFWALADYLVLMK